MSNPDNFRLKNCVHLFSKRIGQHIFSLLTLFNVPVDEVCRKFGKKAKNRRKLANFGIFINFGVNLRFFHMENNAYYLFETPTGQRIRAMMSIFNSLIYEVYRKYDENCIKSSKIGSFWFFVIFGSFSFQKTLIYLLINDY